ncbi:GNAT family N-acetyltransferase [Flexithrix dorotheae]|uniref:GNAT family N-acetyltransferase n=1 Tax=Flexithrix dorotheae TaxID=70993 RepID=UPI00037B85CE|nr:GNAT family N-acetyltransferase [Flexithrix dorotheae]
MKIVHEVEGQKGKFFIKPEYETLAEMTYSKAGTRMIIIDHTEVSEELKGQGIGKKLVYEAVEWARKNNMKIIPLCPFAKSVFQKEKEIRDVLS